MNNNLTVLKTKCLIQVNIIDMINRLSNLNILLLLRKGTIDSIILLFIKAPLLCSKLCTLLTLNTLLLVINLLSRNNVFNVGTTPIEVIESLVTWYKVVNKEIVRVGSDKCDTICVKAILAIDWIGLENRDKYIN